MKYIAASVLTLSLLAAGSAVAAPHNDRGPQHGNGPAAHHAPPARPGVVAAPKKVVPAPHHAPPRVVKAPQHAPPLPPRHVSYVPRRGDRLPPTMRGYRINDWRHAGLRQPPRGHEWRRVDGRDLLVAVATGVIADIILRSY